MADAAGAFRSRATALGKVWDGNAGLWFDKFCDQWATDFSGLAGEDAKRVWVDSVIRPPGKPSVKAGNPDLLAEQARRRRSLVEASGGVVLDMVLESRLTTGLGRRHPVENGFAWHHTLGVPFLAGAGVKGLTRAWATDAGAKDIDRVFGPLPRAKELHVGSVILLDALPVAPVQLVAEVMTPHAGPWNLASPETAAQTPPGDWHSPNPIPFLAVEAGAVFQFAILPRPVAGVARMDLTPVVGWLSEALSWLGAGAKTAIGFGRFHPTGAKPPTDPVSPFHKASSAGRPGAAASGATGGSRAFVDGELVEILRREGGKVVVRFVESGDVETVKEEEIE